LSDLTAGPARYVGRKTTDRTSTRARLLDAAARLLGASAIEANRRPFGALHRLRLPEVAQKAGRTTGAITATWPTKLDFLAALAERILDPGRLPPSPFDDLGVEPSLSSHDLAERVAAVATKSFEQLQHGPAYVLALSLWPNRADPRVRRLLISYYRFRVERYRTLMEALSCHGVTPRGDLTAYDVASALAALEEGLALHARFTEEPRCNRAERCDAPHRFAELFAFGVCTLIGSLCEDPARNEWWSGPASIR
jgi:AcrR family transcriptional regulator